MFTTQVELLSTVSAFTANFWTFYGVISVAQECKSWKNVVVFFSCKNHYNIMVILDFVSSVKRTGSGHCKFQALSGKQNVVST